MNHAQSRQCVGRSSSRDAFSDVGKPAVARVLRVSFHKELEIHSLEHADMRQHHEVLGHEVALILAWIVVRVDRQCLALVRMSREITSLLPFPPLRSV